MLSVNCSIRSLIFCQRNLKVGRTGELGPRCGFHTTPKLSAEDKPAGGKCIEKCPKKQREMMAALQDNSLKYLQPSTQQYSTKYFVMAEPRIPPFVDISLEEDCKLRQACARAKSGKK